MADKAVSAPYQYIVLHQSCRNDMGKLAVHAAHAAGESCFAGPAPEDCRVIALVANKSDEIVAAAARLRDNLIAHAVIFEPDPPYSGAAVALGVMPATTNRDLIKELLSDFRLLR